MKRTALITTFFLILFNLNAQESFRQRFLEANTLMEENQPKVALPIWLKLQTEQPANFNVNYKVGLCYIKSANDKKEALKYLTIAAQSTTKNYDPYSSSEKDSPIESYFYLARAYHLNYELNNAMLNYNSFKEKITKKHYLYNEVEHHINQCKYAKIAVENPVNIKVSNMGEVINSAYGDYSPVMSIDESSLFFTSRRLRKDSSNYYIKDVDDGKHFEDIYVAHNYDGVWTEPELLGLNTEGHEATVNISIDGQMLFIYKDDNGDGNIYTSTLEDGEWATPIKLGSDINLESYETHAHMNPDGNVLYFVSDRKKGFGGKDIYMCKKLPNGEWAKAQNIGDMLNTQYDEDGVFIHPDGKTMYFSSKGHTSIGGYDIFSSTMDDAGNWSKPINMGYPINSTDDDVFFVTSADGKRGYYSSFKEQGYGDKDIYKISLEDADAKPLTLLTAYIKIRGQEGTPEDATITITNNETDEREKIYRPRKKDGKFSIILTPGNDYHIVYSAANYTQEEDLYIPPISAYQEINRGIDLDDVVFGNSNQKLAKLIGTVKDTENKNISNVSVDLYNSSGKKIESQITNTKGVFEFTVEQNKKFIAIARKKGYLNSSKSIKKFEILEQDVFKIELILEKDAGASLIALITDKTNNKPLEGVFLHILDKKTGKKDIFITSKNGEYALPLNGRAILETVSFNFKLEKKGFITKNPPTYVVKLEQPKKYIINDKLDLAMVPTTESSSMSDGADNPNDSRVKALEAIIDNLKKQIDVLSVKNNTNNVNTNYTPNEGVIASYQEYFNYNVKSVNTSSTKYLDMVNKAVKQANSTGSVIIQIESSASHVPTKTYKTNGNLASKRAKDASEKIIASLVKKGVKKEKIIISNINSSVGGPKYNSDFGNTSIYEKYQYVIIKVK